MLNVELKAAYPAILVEPKDLVTVQIFTEPDQSSYVARVEYADSDSVIKVGPTVDRELDNLRRLQSCPHIAQPIASGHNPRLNAHYGLNPDWYYLVEQFAPDQGISSPIESFGPFYEKILNSLEWIDHAGLIWADIDWNNILRDEVAPILIDLEHVCSPGVAPTIGTARSAPLEQFLGHPIDFSRNVYGAGMLLLHKISGLDAEGCYWGWGPLTETGNIPVLRANREYLVPGSAQHTALSLLIKKACARDAGNRIQQIEDFHSQFTKAWYQPDSYLGST